MTTRRTNKPTVGTAEDFGVDPDGGKWVASCDPHGVFVYTATKAAALTSLTHNFCDECRDGELAGPASGEQ